MASPTEITATRAMRLKVLYTFDAESKINCLARWPHVLEVQTAFVDDLTQIGAVELWTCLQALISSSPELVSHETLDYAIYAYDYSEEGTPLSGQGMLSSALNQNAVETSADTLAQVITGKVTKNVLGLFSGNGQETLEVKLKLTPVAKRVHTNSMLRRSSSHDFSGASQHSIDDEEWANLTLNNDPPFPTRQPTGSGSPVDSTGLDNMHRILHEGSVPRETSVNRSSESLHVSSDSRPITRAGTPGHGQSFNQPSRPSVSQLSRPSSRASIRGTSQPVSHKRKESFNSGYYSGDDIQTDEGPLRKRARVVQVGAPSRAELNIERQPESLRMVASTASSVRVHRPAAFSPALSIVQGNSSAEEPIRPPTPIPGSGRPGNRRKQIEPSNLRAGSQSRTPSEMSHTGPVVTDAVDLSAQSPEFFGGPSIASTPANIPSSPPFITNHNTVPSSPMLPPPPPGQPAFDFLSAWTDRIDRNVSKTMDDVHDDSGIDLQLQTNFEQSVGMEMYNQLGPGFEDGSQLNDEIRRASLPPLPSPSRQTAPSKRPISRAHSSKPAVRPGMSSPKLAPAPYPRARQLEEEIGLQPSFPAVVASDPVGRPLQRSHTWAGDMSDVPMSDGPTGEVARAKSISKKKVGREQTKARLENAILQNEIPPFCENCGTIETPAWRRVFAHTMPGHLYDSIQIWPENQGAYVWKQVVETAEDGTITTFRAYKLAKRPEDKGADWTNVTLCNPCGLWFHKNKCMRPEEKWAKNPKDPNQKKKRVYRPKSRRVAAKKGQEDDTRSDAPDQASEGSSPVDAATEAEVETEDEVQRRDVDAAHQGQPHSHAPATSTHQGPAIRTSTAAHHSSAGFELRTFGAGPPINQGTHSDPAATDLTPKPLRRQLFPSPTNKSLPTTQAVSTKSTPTKPLSEVSNVCRRSPRLNQPTDVLKMYMKTPDASEKENQPSQSDYDDEFNDLFNDDGDCFVLPPQTPTPTRRSDRLLLKTPTKMASGSNLRTPSARITPNAHQALQGLQDLKTPGRDFIMGSNRTVEEMTPGTRLIHDTLIEEAAAEPKAKKSGKTSSPVPSASVTAPPLSQQQTDSDFPDLPTLDGLSPRQLAAFDERGFSDLDMNLEEMFSQNQQLTTSPPKGFFNFLNDHLIDPALTADQWNKNGAIDSTSPSAGTLLTAEGTVGLRRSPRKNRSGGA